MKNIKLIIAASLLSISTVTLSGQTFASSTFEDKLRYVNEPFNKRECIKRCNGANKICYQNRNPLTQCKNNYNHCLNMCDEGVYTWRKGFY